MKGQVMLHVSLKRIIAPVACIILLSATTVSAQGDRLVSSIGRYAINSDNGSIVVDTDDIEANAQAIAGLQGQLGGLSFRFATEKDVNGSGDDTKGYYWSKDPSDPTGEKWVKVGAVGSAISSDVLDGKKFSSEAGVDIEGTMPNPTSASISAVTNPSTNLTAGGSTVTINNNANTADDHSSNVSQINLGIGEQITIPHGYYNKDIVITNGVSNRGSTPTCILTENVKSQTFPAGYYDTFTVFAEIPNPPDVKMTYTHHLHALDSTANGIENESTQKESVSSDVIYADNYQSSVCSGCFTTPRYYIPSYTTTKYCTCTARWTTEEDGITRCSGCGHGPHAGRTCGKNLGTNTVVAHWSTTNEGGRATTINYTVSCGKLSGEVTDIHIHY